MNPIQTIEQIEAEHPAEWVLIADPEVDAATLEVRSGRVVFHTTDRDQLGSKAIELRLPDYAVYYFGTMPDNMALVL